MKSFIDADILIWHLRGERKAINFLRKMMNDPDSNYGRVPCNGRK